MNFFLPKQIKIGYQEKKDTYTGKLAYVIYYDDKNKLRKELSFNNWIDKKINTDKYENLPISGFVLNKKVGGYKNDYNFRQAYTRIYDPRGFEFEITIENLLYILTYCTSIKGKGLEGEFVYTWNNKDLFLMPIDSPEYKKIKKHSEDLYKSEYFKPNELKIGYIYNNKNNEQFVYLGKRPYYELDYKYFIIYNNKLVDTQHIKYYDKDTYIKNIYIKSQKLYYWFFKVDCQKYLPRIYSGLMTFKTISKKFIKQDNIEYCLWMNEIYQALKDNYKFHKPLLDMYKYKRINFEDINNFTTQYLKGQQRYYLKNDIYYPIILKYRWERGGNYKYGIMFEDTTCTDYYSLIELLKLCPLYIREYQLENNEYTTL